MNQQDGPGALANAFVIGWTLAVVGAKIAATVGVVAVLQALGMPEVASYFVGGFALFVLVSA